MVRNTRWLALALLVTAFNAVVAERCGPLLWHAWGGIAYTRVALLLLAGALSSTLTNVWAHTVALVRPRVSDAYSVDCPAGTQWEGADV